MTDLKQIGLVIVEDFISEDEENEIIAHLAELPPPKASVTRNVWRYGKPGYYKSFLVSETIPEYLEAICDKLFLGKYVSERPNSITINFYVEKSFIPPHIDHADSGEVITIVSFMNEVEMIFENGGEIIPMTIKPRSLMQFKGSVRFGWKHGIRKIENQRYSLVFRHNK